MNSFLLVLSVIQHVETRSLVREVLKEQGHRVIECRDVLQARSLLINGIAPDFVLFEPLAGCLPAECDFLRLLRNSGGRICLLASPAEKEIRALAVELGVDPILDAPVTRGELELVVEKLSGRSADSGRPELAVGHSAGGPVRSSAPISSAGLPLIEELGDNRYFLAASPAMLDIHRQARLLAGLDVTVLILGESGTGKEVVASLIHRHSRRSRHKMLNVNCAALPVDLLESELFGHRQGAFTGAVRDHAGRFEQADRGTLLLDEIGEISAQMQAKLLHVLQDGQFTRLGGQESTRVDVRILAATNVEMENALRDKSFREDLYYRLSAFTIHVPPLRERREEIPWLIEETIRRAPAEMKDGRDIRFSSRLMDAAWLYDWRGNIRELRNFVIRTIVLDSQDTALRELEGKIAARIVPERVSAAAAEPSGAPIQCAGMRSVVRDLKDRTEAHMIREALDASGWNRRHAAQNLNISYRALLYKIQQHRLAPTMARGMN